jgi:hypothetical protein
VNNTIYHYPSLKIATAQRRISDRGCGESGLSSDLFSSSGQNIFLGKPQLSLYLNSRKLPEDQ